MRIFLAVLISIMLSSCDIILDEALDCIDNDRPRFSQNQLDHAVLNQEYSEELSVSIENEPYDDWYRYDFRVDGHLPPGLIMNQFNNRTMRIYGTPTETGSYIFDLKVYAFEPNQGYDDDWEEGYDDGDDLCRNYHRQSYVLLVEEERTDF